MTAVADAEEQLGLTLPRSLRSVYDTGDGRFRQDGEWWVVWPLARLVSDNGQAWHEGRLPRSLLAFGDDGTGDPFCVRLGEDDDEVLRWSWIDSTEQGPEGSMADFMKAWVDAG